MKTVQSRNIDDFSNSIFVGLNQNSYKTELKNSKNSSFEPERIYSPAVPTYYTLEENKKLALSYFLNILYKEEDLDILMINLMSMPNGELKKHYKHRPLKAGKLKTEARFNFKEVSKFELLDKQPSRIKVIYFNENISEELKKKLWFFGKNY